MKDDNKLREDAVKMLNEKFPTRYAEFIIDLMLDFHKSQREKELQASNAMAERLAFMLKEANESLEYRGIFMVGIPELLTEYQNSKK